MDMLILIPLMYVYTVYAKVANAGVWLRISCGVRTAKGFDGAQCRRLPKDVLPKNCRAGISRSFKNVPG